MQTLIRLGVCLLSACVPVFQPLQGAEPPTRGRILVLDNERTLEGSIIRYDDQYNIQRSIGETWVTADRVLHLCDTYEEAARFLRTRANLADPDERLRLARWCQKHDLREQALEHVTAAVALRPKHAESRRLLSYLQRGPTVAPAPPASTSEVAETEPVTPPAPIELGPEAMAQFVTKVQPILMNACANCHATGRGGAFKLVRGLGTSPVSTRTTQQNLSAVLAQISLELPQTSPLLVKAIGIHGEASQPPLKGPQIAAFHTLESWVRQLATKHPQLRDQTSKIVATAAPTEPEPTPEARPTAWAAEARPKPAPAKAADPFDPAVFNRQMHPQPRP